LTDSERTVVHGDEIDLNDEDEEENVLTFPLPTKTTLPLSHDGDRKSVILKNGDTDNAKDSEHKDQLFSTKEPYPQQGQSPTLPQADLDLTHSSVRNKLPAESALRNISI